MMRAIRHFFLTRALREKLLLLAAVWNCLRRPSFAAGVRAAVRAPEGVVARAHGSQQVRHG